MQWLPGLRACSPCVMQEMMGDSSIPPASPEPGGTSEPRKQPSAAANPKRRVYKDTTKRDRLISLLVASMVVVFIVFAVLEMSKGYRGVTGVITEKRFIAEPETRLTVGQGGLQKRELAGTYFFIVHVDRDGRDYTIRVPKEQYDAKAEGDEYYFVRPPGQVDAN